MFVNINVDSVGVIVNFMFVVGASFLASVVSMVSLCCLCKRFGC